MARAAVILLITFLAPSSIHIHLSIHLPLCTQAEQESGHTHTHTHRHTHTQTHTHTHTDTHTHKTTEAFAQCSQMEEGQQVITGLRMTLKIRTFTQTWHQFKTTCCTEAFTFVW